MVTRSSLTKAELVLARQQDAGRDLPRRERACRLEGALGELPQSGDRDDGKRSPATSAAETLPVARATR